MAFYSGNQYEEFMILNRIGGPYRIYWWALILTNVLAPQAIWLRKVRASPALIFVTSRSGESNSAIRP